MQIEIILDNGEKHYLECYKDIFKYDNIYSLDVSNNERVNITKIPKNLKIFKCNNNFLRQLPEIPESLIELDCSNNYISSLPSLKNIKKLICFNNKFEKHFFSSLTNIEIIF